METKHTITDHELFNLIAREDENAFRILFDRYRQELYAVAMKLSKSPLKSEEIIQEVFIATWVSRSRLPAVEKPDAYLYRILYNKINDYLRKESNHERILHDSRLLQVQGGNPTLETLDFRESSILIDKALQLLPTQQKTVYKLSRQQGLSIDEIAEELQISPHTVKSHLARALTFIRHYLKDVAFATALISSFGKMPPL